MGKFVIKNVRPYGEDEVQLLIDGGVIQAIGKDLSLDETDESFEVIDAGGKVLLPGLVDMTFTCASRAARTQKPSPPAPMRQPRAALPPCSPWRTRAP